MTEGEKEEFEGRSCTPRSASTPRTTLDSPHPPSSPLHPLQTISFSHKRSSTDLGGGLRGAGTGRAGGGDVTDLTAVVASSALLLGALSGDVTVLAAVVASLATSSGTATETTAEASATTATTGRRAFTRDVAYTTASVARLATLAASVSATAVTATVASSETTLATTGLGAHSGDVSGLTASVAVTGGSTTSTSSSTGSGSGRASGRKVTFLAARVASLSLGVGALSAQVAGLATAVASGGAGGRAGRSDVAGLATVEAVSSSTEHFIIVFVVVVGRVGIRF